MQQLLSPVYNLTLATLHHLSEEEEEDDDEDEGDRRRQKNEEEEELWDRSNTAATWMYKSSQWGVYISIWHTKKSTTEEDCTLVTLDVNRKLNCVSSQSSLRNSLREFYKKKKTQLNIWMSLIHKTTNQTRLHITADQWQQSTNISETYLSAPAMMMMMMMKMKEALLFVLLQGFSCRRRSGVNHHCVCVCVCVCGVISKYIRGNFHSSSSSSSSSSVIIWGQSFISSPTEQTTGC